MPSKNQVIGVLLGGTVKYWNCDNASPVQEYKRHKGAIEAMLTHSDGAVWYASESSTFVWHPEQEVQAIQEFSGIHT